MRIIAKISLTIYVLKVIIEVITNVFDKEVKKGHHFYEKGCIQAIPKSLIDIVCV